MSAPKHVPARCLLCGAFMKVETYSYVDSQGVTQRGTLYRCNNTRNVSHEDYEDAY